MGTVLAETQKLKDVAEEFEKVGGDGGWNAWAAKDGPCSAASAAGRALMGRARGVHCAEPPSGPSLGGDWTLGLLCLPGPDAPKCSQPSAAPCCAALHSSSLFSLQPLRCACLWPALPPQDLFLQKLAEAEERLAEMEGLRYRVKELEEENVALTQVGAGARCLWVLWALCVCVCWWVLARVLVGGASY